MNRRGSMTVMSGTGEGRHLSGASAEGERLAGWAASVRRSTLRRLLAVPAGLEGMRVGSGAMSFADLAQHLIDADAWLERKLREPELPAMQGRAGSASIADRAAWDRLLEELERSGRRRHDLLRGLDRAALGRRLPDERFGGEVSVWWIVVRGNLEHEAHHRGQMAAGLRAAADRCAEGA